jgi:hypothetical protein
MRQRIAEQAHQPVAQLFSDMTAHFSDRSGSGVEIGTHEVAPFLGIELRRRVLAWPFRRSCD